jgi:PAS domain-containing protein
MWRDLKPAPDGTITPGYSIPGAILVSVEAGLILLNLAALGWLFANSPQHRWPVVTLFSGGLIARGLYPLRVFRVAIPISVDLIVIAFGLLWLVYAAVLFGFRIFDPLPAARCAVLEQMQAGFAVFDENWRVVSLNPAAERMLGISTDDAQGRRWKELVSGVEGLPSIPLKMCRKATRYNGGHVTCICLLCYCLASLTTILQ